MRRPNPFAEGGLTCESPGRLCTGTSVRLGSHRHVGCHALPPRISLRTPSFTSLSWEEPSTQDLASWQRSVQSLLGPVLDSGPPECVLFHGTEVVCLLPGTPAGPWPQDVVATSTSWSILDSTDWRGHECLSFCVWLISLNLVCLMWVAFTCERSVLTGPFPPLTLGWGLRR